MPRRRKRTRILLAEWSPLDREWLTTCLGRDFDVSPVFAVPYSASEEPVDVVVLGPTYSCSARLIGRARLLWPGVQVVAVEDRAGPGRVLADGAVLTPAAGTLDEVVRSLVAPVLV